VEETASTAMLAPTLAHRLLARTRPVRREFAVCICIFAKSLGSKGFFFCEDLLRHLPFVSTVINEDNQTHTKSKEQLVSMKAIIKIYKYVNMEKSENMQS
jgi:hypothetical protein